MTKDGRQLQTSPLQLTDDKALLAEYALYSQVADMYYNGGMKVSEIASALNFSASKVSRLLEKARLKGVVSITVKRVYERLSDMETSLKETFHLRDALVINAYDAETYEQELQSVTDYASVYVSDLLNGKRILGVSNGNAVNQISRKIHALHPCELDVVQIIGSGSNTFQAVESRELVQRIGELYPGGRCHFLNTPIFMEDALARDRLLKEPSVAAVFDVMRASDLLLTGIGGFSTVRQTLNPGVFREYQTDPLLHEMEEKHAVGSVCALYYDIDGTLIDCEWNKKCVGMSFDDIRQHPMTIGVVCGTQKVRAVLGALRAGLINVLITNAHLAADLCRYGDTGA